MSLSIHHRARNRGFNTKLHTSGRWALSVLIAATMLVLGTGPATAGEERFTDPNDTMGFDIRGVKVRYGDRLTIRVAHDGKTAIGQKYKYWFDTNAENQGPEYSFTFTPNSDFTRFRRVNGFADSGRRVTTCGQMWGGSADIFQPRRDVLATIGPRCLGLPNRVKVSVRLVTDGRDDWAPGFRRFYRWVTRY